MRTWGDVVNETLQIIASYSNKGAILVNGKNNADYKLSMPHSANFAMREMAALRPIIKKLQIENTGETNKFDMIALTAEDDESDFWQVDNVCFYDGESYVKNYPFDTETEKTLIVGKDDIGVFDVFYRVYPPVIKADTQDSFILADNKRDDLLCEECIDAVPLYIASRIFLNDEPSYAQDFAYQYDAKKEFIKTSGGSSAKRITIIGGI